MLDALLVDFHQAFSKFTNRTVSTFQTAKVFFRLISCALSPCRRKVSKHYSPPQTYHSPVFLTPLTWIIDVQFPSSKIPLCELLVCSLTIIFERKVSMY